MKNIKISLKAQRNALVVCIGTDIPILTWDEFTVLGTIEDLIEEKKTNILSFDEIFNIYTYDKVARFNLISRLIKKKAISRKNIDSKNHYYEIIPKISFRKSKQIRTYFPRSIKEKVSLLKAFKR